MVPVGWKKTGVHAPSASRSATRARRISEVELQGKRAAIELTTGFAAPLQVEAQRAVASEGEALLEANAPRLVGFPHEVVEAAGVGVRAPARREIDHRSNAGAGADAVAALQLSIQAQG